MYTIDYFIDKFQNIPENKWCIDRYENSSGQKCAQGHCVNDIQDLSEVIALIDLFGIDKCGAVNIALINNGKDPRYQQDHPKQRVLAALYDLKMKQNSTRTVYVTVGDEVTEELKEISVSN